MRKKSIKKFIKSEGLIFSKKLGQSFLFSKEILKEIVKIAEVEKNDIILEVGAGFGTLTEEIAKKAKKVIAVEKDKKLLTFLKEKFKGRKNIEIISGDILKMKLKLKNYKLLGNLPYSISKEILRKFLEKQSCRPKLLVVMVQKEVAKSICSKAPKMTKLGAIFQFLAKIELKKIVKKENFWPSPKVDGAIIKIFPKKKLSPEIKERLLKFINAGFAHPRKSLYNNLSKKKTLSKELFEKWCRKRGLLFSTRAENLSLADWLSLIFTFKNF